MNKLQCRIQNFKSRSKSVKLKITEILIEQNYSCPICSSYLNHTDYFSSLYVMNDEARNMVGITCLNCSERLKAFDLDIELMTGAINYLVKLLNRNK